MHVETTITCAHYRQHLIMKTKNCFLDMYKWSFNHLYVMHIQSSRWNICQNVIFYFKKIVSPIFLKNRMLNNKLGIVYGVFLNLEYMITHSTIHPWKWTSLEELINLVFHIVNSLGRIVVHKMYTIGASSLDLNAMRNSKLGIVLFSPIVNGCIKLETKTFRVWRIVENVLSIIVENVL